MLSGKHIFNEDESVTEVKVLDKITTEIVKEKETKSSSSSSESSSSTVTDNTAVQNQDATLHYIGVLTSTLSVGSEAYIQQYTVYVDNKAYYKRNNIYIPLSEKRLISSRNKTYGFPEGTPKYSQYQSRR